MTVHRFNITVPEKYTSGGQERTKWNNVGTMTVFEKDDGNISRIIEIPAIGLKANVFPWEKREDAAKAPQQEEAPLPEEAPEEQVNTDGIPF